MARILYVDDDPDIREIAQMALQLDPGFEVKLCASGWEALEAFQSDPPWIPDLILLDVMMPQIDGPTTLLKLRELPAAAEVPVVFITARVQSAEVEQLKSLGAAAVIAKPFNPMTLSAQVKEHLP